MAGRNRRLLSDELAEVGRRERQRGVAKVGKPQSSYRGRADLKNI
jgi:hypothetical protein